MPIYTTPLPQLGSTDLQELLDSSAAENVRLEFKLLVPNKDETLKKLSSFANTFGGFMVVGAKANSVDGRIEDLPGVGIQSSYKQTIAQWCFDGVSPPLVAGVSDPIPTPSGNGKVCYVIYVAKSDVAPHFLNGRKGIWVRTDEFSAHFEARLANENELRHLFDRRKLTLNAETCSLTVLGGDLTLTLRGQAQIVAATEHHWVLVSSFALVLDFLRDKSVSKNF
jgi:predicted HTH transcriptional regulator